MEKNIFKDYVSQKVESIIYRCLAERSNLIFVIVGLNDIIDIERFKSQIDDFDTFNLLCDESVFDKKWFRRIFLELSDDQKDYHIISYPQYKYIVSNLNDSYFKDKIVFINDNLRRLFLLEKEAYIEKSDDGKRPDKLPLFEAEQIQLDDKYYFSIIAPSEDYIIEDIFTEKLICTKTTDDCTDGIIDVNSDKYALDVFINECFSNNRLDSKVTVKSFSKHPLKNDNKQLEKLNYLLNQFGGGICLFNEEPISENYTVIKETADLLHKYWGKNATFRNLSVYKNPDVDKEIVEISQGQLVDIIIDEYKKSKRKSDSRDLFLTAPTGAGKSLLFQLPAFYISGKGDVTIIVSPLIALMKDQVKAIKNERHFEKVAYINSELSILDRDKIIGEIQNGGIDILYLSPELLLSYDLSFFIGNRILGLLVIDEAHLITTWGRDFRVDYWFLGNYIRKMRKFRDNKFPMVAVTATAVYGGGNDMVFDSIDSLYMQNPHIFIGQVKRNDIQFVISNYESFKQGYEKRKMQQTIDFIKVASDSNVKTIVYFPYTKHIIQLSNILPSDLRASVAAYFGSMDSDMKEYSYRQFKSGEKKIMICTKAFGMGVDISDIQVVYHHAPSGMLPDYIQEIGRVARKKEIQGYAVLDYSPQDQKYSKTLHGMSAIRQWQLHEMLKKLHSLYVKNGRKRNMLVSVDDFSYIFGTNEIDQKVLTGFMMLEKDYLAKHQFNVLIARPKKLFSVVYARLSEEDFSKLNSYYPNMHTKYHNQGNGNVIIDLDLAKLWEANFYQKSFPVIKRDFYNGKLFESIGVSISPQLKITYSLSKTFQETYKTLADFFESLKELFCELSGGYFTQDEFFDKLYNIIKNKRKSEKLAKFVLSTYSKNVGNDGYNTFLQMRNTWGRENYSIINTRYLETFIYLLKHLSNLFDDTSGQIKSKFIAVKNNSSIEFIRLGYFIELLELGSYEISGGENPVVFIRINDPDRIEKDAFRNTYKNNLLKKTLDKFDISKEIFDYFFCRQFSNSERWDFIEDFFLGSDNDDLMKNYIGNSESNKVCIADFIKNIPPLPENEFEEIHDDENPNIFFANPEVFYNEDSLLTIDTPDGLRTCTISKWLSINPILLNEVRVKNNLKVSSKVFEVLISKIKQNKEYFRDSRGLKMKIEFKGYTGLVQAIVPYKDKPVEFYKWWCKNDDKISMTEEEKIKLFIRVQELAPDVLLKKHRL